MPFTSSGSGLLCDTKDSGEVKDLAHFRKCNQNKLVIAHININSLRNKFELLTEKTKGKFLKQKLAKASPTVNSKWMVLATPVE